MTIVPPAWLANQMLRIYERTSIRGSANACGGTTLYVYGKIAIPSMSTYELWKHATETTQNEARIEGETDTAPHCTTCKDVCMRGIGIGIGLPACMPAGEHNTRDGIDPCPCTRLSSSSSLKYRFVSNNTHQLQHCCNSKRGT